MVFRTRYRHIEDGFGLRPIAFRDMSRECGGGNKPRWYRLGNCPQRPLLRRTAPAFARSRLHAYTRRQVQPATESVNVDNTGGYVSTRTSARRCATGDGSRRPLPHRAPISYYSECYRRSEAVRPVYHCSAGGSARHSRLVHRNTLRVSCAQELRGADGGLFRRRPPPAAGARRPAPVGADHRRAAPSAISRHGKINGWLVSLQHQNGPARPVRPHAPTQCRHKVASSAVALCPIMESG
ncbi:hypothetical protein EVAR_68055_1 [Eumeta japonica]|uniref:Uncharacterized protein n=1 Tax=Eumeta variegata TaxID=151549 RepID=A0A4C1ZTX6_EUMVA|nr:hypothetical protein EVAR_68055_1 [Eumeta japonica]